MTERSSFGGRESTTTRAEPQLTRLNLFATPLLIATLPDAQRINEALKRTILEREAAEPAQRLDDRGWRSQWDLARWGGAPAHSVVDFVRSIVDPMTVDRAGARQPVAWRVSCRAQVNRHGHGGEFRTNPGTLWSAEYFVDDGGVGADPSLGGQFEIQDPRGVATVMYAPYLTFAGEDGAALGEAHRLVPRSGMAVVYPSWLSHAARPYLGTRERISIAINFSLAAL